MGGGDNVEFTLPKGGVAALGVFPKTVVSKGGGVFTCPEPMSLAVVDLATGKTLATGEHKIELPAPTGGNRLGVRALQGGYLVQDCMEASAAGG